MSRSDQFSHPPIVPIHSQTEPNQVIGLGTSAVEFTHKSKTFQEQATVTMRFMPNDQLLFVIPAEGKNPLFGVELFLDDDWDGKLTLTDRGLTLDVSCKGTGGEYGAIAFSPRSSGVTVTSPSQAISTATFHLFNFPAFKGPDDYILITGEPPPQGGTVCGRVILKTDGWRITIAATDKTDAVCKALKKEGGFVITHMGKIEREDGSVFSSEQLKDLLHCLRLFLSFALGRWAGVAFPIGFNSSGEKVFEEWGLPWVASGLWNGSCSWLDLHHGELLSQVFPGFMTLWRQELWRPALEGGLYWYLGACDRGTGIGVDTGLILAQTALELLAWSYCVRDRKMVSEKAFQPRGLSAADKLRILASALDIPLEIPANLPAARSQPGSKWQDSMDAITGIRNAIVHPKARNQLPHDACYEGWKLSLWYIDMVLLRLCGHVGQYANRLRDNRWVGQVEPVPWAGK